MLFRLLAKRVNGRIQVFREEDISYRSDLTFNNLQNIPRVPGYAPDLSELRVIDAVAGDELTLAAFHAGYLFVSLASDPNRQCFWQHEGSLSLLKTLDARSGRFLIAVV